MLNKKMVVKHVVRLYRKAGYIYAKAENEEIIKLARHVCKLIKIDIGFTLGCVKIKTLESETMREKCDEILDSLICMSCYTNDEIDKIKKYVDESIRLVEIIKIEC